MAQDSNNTKGSPRTREELLDHWYESVASAGDDRDQTIGIFGGRSASSDGATSSSGARLSRVREIISIVRRYDIFHADI